MTGRTIWKYLITRPIGDHLTYVGTTLHADGQLVLHVYEAGRPR